MNSQDGQGPVGFCSLILLPLNLNWSEQGDALIQTG
jgi:hypothetical protein